MVSTFVQNGLLASIVTSITFLILFLLGYLNKKKVISNEVSRKVVHIGAGTLFLAIYFYNDRGYVSKYFNIFHNVLWTGILLWKSQSFQSREQQYDLVVDTITRSHRRIELLRGPLAFNIVAILCGTVLYRTVVASMMMGILTWGDGLAAVIGSGYGSQRKIYGSKSFDGFLTCFLAGFLASIIYISLLVNFQSIDFLQIAVIAFSGAVIETISPSDLDNFTVPLSIFIINSVLY